MSEGDRQHHGDAEEVMRGHAARALNKLQADIHSRQGGELQSAPPEAGRAVALAAQEKPRWPVKTGHHSTTQDITFTARTTTIEQLLTLERPDDLALSR